MRNLKFLSGILIVVLIFSCSGVKQTQEAMNSGNYLSAINQSIVKLADNKTKKGNQEYVLLLEESFTKNTKRELKQISFLKKEGNAANFERIYNSYLNLYRIQERIQPLLPLRVYDEQRDASFQFKDYTEDLLSSKKRLADFLYANAKNLMTTAKTKYDFRKAYEDLLYLNKISPNYKDTKDLIDSAYNRGLDYVQVALFNSSYIALPQDLEEDLLNFNAYDLNDHWTRYHTNPLAEIDYSYKMNLDFKQISISPEQVNTRVLQREKRIKDGWKYILDASGNVAKDSLGNDRKEDKYITVKARFYEYTQFKDIQISGNVSYIDLISAQQINAYPLSSGFVFENIYANFEGDKRALDDVDLKLINRRPLTFPSNEQMIYDSGEALKNSIKYIVKNNKINSLSYH